MAVFSEVKCERCDKKYPGIRSRCPFCKARRIGSGKYSEDSENSRGKMLICILILAALTVGAATLLLTADPEEDAFIDVPSNYDENDDTDDNGLDDTGLHTITGPGIDGDTYDENENDYENDYEFIPAPPPINSITITINGFIPQFGEYTTRVGERYTAGVRIDPAAANDPDFVSIEWESSNPDAFEVVASPENPASASITHLAAGRGNLIVRVNDLVEYMPVIVVNP